MLLSEYVEPGLSKKRIMEVFMQEGNYPGLVNCTCYTAWLQVMSALVLLTSTKSMLARGNQC